MPETQPDARHYPALDGLRGMAAMLIVWHHFLQLTPAHGRVLSLLSIWLEFTWIGVDLFFVLSGFLITGILADAKGKKNFFRTFYGRRVLRIFPLYYATLIVVLLVLPAIGLHTGISPESQFSYWTYTSNFYFATHEWNANYLSHLWTLAIEEQYYFLWPLVIFLVRDLERLRKGLPLIFTSILLLRIALYHFGYNSIWLSLVTITHCDGLLLGGYLALAVRSLSPTALKGLRPNKIVAIALGAFALFLADLSGLLPEWEAIPKIAYFRAVITLSLLAVLFVWLIHAATQRESGWIYTFFSHRLVRCLGKYSYALYLLHVPLAFLILRRFDLSQLTPKQTMLAEAGLFVLYVGGCVGAAFLSWHLFEKHFLRLKRYLPYSRDRRSTSSA